MKDRNIFIILRVRDLAGGPEMCSQMGAGNDNYMMFLDASKSEDEQAAAFLHECLHIWRNDWNTPGTAGEKEAQLRQDLRRILEKAV